MTVRIVDRRFDSKNKSSVNRSRFLRRFKGQIRKAVSDAINRRGVRDIENGEKISTGETSNMRNIVYSTAVGLEIGYAITNRITLTVEPRLKQFINSISTNKSVNYKPSQVAIVTGLTYSFN